MCFQPLSGKLLRFHIENVTFKWIATRYGNEGVFLTMAGNTTNFIKNCYFYNITTTTGHSSIVYIRRGDAALENCTFLNCSNSFGCVSIYDPLDNVHGVCDSARMTMDNCYFENNGSALFHNAITSVRFSVWTVLILYRNSRRFYIVLINWLIQLFVSLSNQFLKLLKQKLLRCLNISKFLIIF